MNLRVFSMHGKPENNYVIIHNVLQNSFLEYFFLSIADPVNECFIAQESVSNRKSNVEDTI